MTVPLRLHHWAGAIVISALLGGCGDSSTGGETTDAGCIGTTSGEYELSSTFPSELPGVDSAGLAATNLEDDPPTVSLILTGAAVAQTNNAVDLEVGDEFTVAGKSYTLRGACQDKVWLDSIG